MDERLDISYDNEILTRYLLDVDCGVVDDFSVYLNNLNVKESNLYIVKNCMKFCRKRKLIQKDIHNSNHVIWFRSRVKMLIKLLLMISIWALPIVFLSLLIHPFDIYGMGLLLQFFYIHLLSTYIHESLHAIVYWVAQKEANGYFNVDYCSCSFVYNDLSLSPRMKVLVAGSGSLFTIIVIGILWYMFSLEWLVAWIEIGIQLTAIVFGADGKIIRQK